jgi:hypothetical protein
MSAPRHLWILTNMSSCTCVCSCDRFIIPFCSVTTLLLTQRLQLRAFLEPVIEALELPPNLTKSRWEGPRPAPVGIS